VLLDADPLAPTADPSDDSADDSAARSAALRSMPVAATLVGGDIVHAGF
jgi:hypothetical protein